MSERPSGSTSTDAPLVDYRRSTAEQVFERIRDEIISMKLAPGEKISENRLARRFAVSRTPIRAALNQLAGLGFVEVRPQRGTFVTRLSMQFILEARFIRESLEVAVVSHLAEHGLGLAVEDCERILAEQAEAARRRDALAFQRLDDAFHQRLAEATGFGRIGRLIETEKAHMDRVRNLSLVEQAGQYDTVLAQHRAILDAVRSRDPRRAEEAMRVHLRDVFNILKVAPLKHPEYFA
ncbi:MAG: GntR family transcriptional regulator [Gammaproteobacteria bacterium]|nr:MAG: GntR family transcriptional regulator [Gammaproteobacteria bacterium]